MNDTSRAGLFSAKGTAEVIEKLASSRHPELAKDHSRVGCWRDEILRKLRMTCEQNFSTDPDPGRRESIPPYFALQLESWC
jgi:hypothetical protein